MTAQVINLSRSVADTMNKLKASIAWYKSNNGSGVYDKALFKEEKMLKRYFEALFAQDEEESEAA